MNEQLNEAETTVQNHNARSEYFAQVFYGHSLIFHSQFRENGTVFETCSNMLGSSCDVVVNWLTRMSGLIPKTCDLRHHPPVSSGLWTVRSVPVSSGYTLGS